ncbi:MAG: hypothetical protein ACRDDX_03210 [Cellulosilyticaceae bacterium]
MYWELGKEHDQRKELLGQGDKAEVFFMGITKPADIIESATIKKTTVKIISKELIQGTTCKNRPITKVLITGAFEVEVTLRILNKDQKVGIVKPFNQLVELCEPYNGAIEAKVIIESEEVEIVEIPRFGFNISLAWHTCIY